MIEQPVITLDVDWAPDFVIEHIANILSDKKVKATWFITHDSQMVQNLRKNDLFELGLHPNFDPSSTQGSDPDSVLTNLKKIIPQATSLRTHSFNQSTPLILKFQKFGLENDASIFLSKTKNISPHFLKFANLYRFPSFWADDIEMEDKTECWSLDDPIYHTPGLKIFIFHPIHIFLNSRTMEKYNTLKNKKNISLLNPEDVENYVNTNNVGSGIFFEQLTSFLMNYKTYTIQDLNKIYKNL